MRFWNHFIVLCRKYVSFQSNQKIIDLIRTLSVSTRDDFMVCWLDETRFEITYIFWTCSSCSANKKEYHNWTSLALATPGFLVTVRDRKQKSTFYFSRQLSDRSMLLFFSWPSKIPPILMISSISRFKRKFLCTSERRWNRYSSVTYIGCTSTWCVVFEKL